MFILVSTHNRIIADLKESHAKTVALLEAQIAELRRDRDYYREQTLKDAGRPSPQSSTALPADQPATSTNQSSDDLLDSWGVDDLELYREWAAEMVGKLGQATDTKKLWRETYGTSTPLEVRTV